jgi:serine/threonine protein kinase
MRKHKARDTELAVGDALGPYQLEEVLGEGGMGIVFRAVRTRDGTVVALKVLKQTLSGDEVFRKRFVHEARAAREVQDKHLVPILDAGELEGHHYLAVRYVKGPSLADHIAEKGFVSLRLLARIVPQIAAGLDALHAAGLVHRDVKPPNIMLDEGETAALTDFGLAKGRDYTALTKQGQVMGTVDYLAPELIKGSAATPATDIYGLGCTVYECVAGTPPFADRGIFQVAVAHLEDEPANPCAGRSDLPPSLSWAVLQALAKDPSGRPPTAMAYAQGIRMAAAEAGAT